MLSEAVLITGRKQGEVVDASNNEVSRCWFEGHRGTKQCHSNSHAWSGLTDAGLVREYSTAVRGATE